MLSCHNPEISSTQANTSLHESQLCRKRMVCLFSLFLRKMSYPARRVGRVCPLPFFGYRRLIIVTAPAMLFVYCEDAN
jgi:hypothetical protein